MFADAFMNVLSFSKYLIFRRLLNVEIFSLDNFFVLYIELGESEAVKTILPWHPASISYLLIVCASFN